MRSARKIGGLAAMIVRELPATMRSIKMERM